MGITQEFLATVSTALENGNVLRPGIDMELREAFPGIPFTLCNDNDIPSRLKPLAQGNGFALYGINTGGHCAALTANMEATAGLAIALVDDEN